MKIDLSSLKAFSSEVTPECAEFISSLQKRDSITDFAENLDKLTEWYSTLGKVEMGRWAQVLNDCYEVLEAATHEHPDTGMVIDRSDEFDRPVISVLRFTSLLFENSFSRSVYPSMGHLFKLLDSNKMFIVVQTLRLLLVISKSSRYITQHVRNYDKRLLYMKLTANTECWSVGLRSHKMSDFCAENASSVVDLTQHLGVRTCGGAVRIFNVDLSKSIFDAISGLRQLFSSEEVEESERILASTKLRLVYNFQTLCGRVQCIMTRLLSISVLFYSRCLLDDWRINCFLQDDFIEQICALIQIDSPQMDGLKTEAMKTLASIVFLEKPRKIQLVVDCLGLNSYHGFTSALIRTCVDKLKAGEIETNSEYSVSFVTALFSLVYHIAGFDYGGDALVSCSMIGSLLTVVRTHSLPESQISFVTRAVRIIDILTGIDVSEFNGNDGMNVIVERFVHEVANCKRHSAAAIEGQTVVCHHQRVALMKSLLNFLKRAIADTNYAAQIRRIMEGDLPRSIIYIIQNPEYFGPSLLHCAMQLTTSFIYQEPAQLTFLQDNGLTEAVLTSLFNEKFPVSRDIVTSLPNICAALCLNERGLKCFNEHKPFARIFCIIFSTKFIMSLKKRKTEILEAASSLGTAFDELMRHQPTLRKNLMKAFADILMCMLDTIKQTKSPRCVISWTVGKTPSPEDEFLRSCESTNNLPFGVEPTPPSDANLNALHASPSEGSLGQSENSTSLDVKKPASNTFHLCHQYEGFQLMPLGDYLGMIGAMVEAILTNRAAHENSAAMVEFRIPSLFMSFLTLNRPYPTLFQSTYLYNLPNIMRHLMAQTNDYAVITVLMQSFYDQLVQYTPANQLEDFDNNRMFLVNRLNGLGYVVCNFLKTALNNVHDVRNTLLPYFGASGLKVIVEVFAMFRHLYLDVITIEAHNRNSGGAILCTVERVDLRTDVGAERYTPPPISRSIAPASLLSDQIDVTDPPTSSLSASSPAKVSVSTQTTKLKSIELMHTAIQRLQRQLADILTHMGRIFTSTVTRPRRNQEKTSFIVHATKASAKLFEGMERLMRYDPVIFESKNWTMYICHVLSMLKKLLFEESHLPPMRSDSGSSTSIMLPFFYDSGCHRAFFSLGQFLIERESELLGGVLTTNWLNIIQRLVSANNIINNNGKNKNEAPRLSVEGFDSNKYLAICQHDSLMVLQTFFEHVMNPHRLNPEKSHDFMEKILGTIQVLICGIVQLNETDKKAEKQPALDLLLNEIDTDKVQRLVEMGFSQSDAVDALLIHSSVSDATNYLISMAPTTSGGEPPPAAASTSSSTTAPGASASSTATANIPIQREASTNLSVAAVAAAGNNTSAAIVRPQQPPTSQPEQPAADPSDSALQQLIHELERQENLTRSAESSTSGEVEQMDVIDHTYYRPSSALDPAEALKFDRILPYEKDMKKLKTIEFKEIIDFLYEKIVPDCVAIVERDPSLVFSVAELFAVFMNEPNVSEWIRNTFVVKLMRDRARLADRIRTRRADEAAEEADVVPAEMCRSFSALLQLFCMMWQSLENIRSHTLVGGEFIDAMAEMVLELKERDFEAEHVYGLLSAVFLCMDMYDRKRRIDLRRAYFNENVEHVQWSYSVHDRDRYFPQSVDASMRDYPPLCSAELNRAFRAGQTSTRVTIAEKSYVVNFIDMYQRPAEATIGASAAGGPVYARAKLKPGFAIHSFEWLCANDVPSLGRPAHYNATMLVLLLDVLRRAASDANSEAVNKTLKSLNMTYAVLSLMLRLLTIDGMTNVFIQNDGIRAILCLICAERRRTILTLATLILRVCVEEDEGDKTLQDAYETIMRCVHADVVVSLSELTARSGFKKSNRDFNRVARFLRSLSARSAHAYIEAMERTFHIRDNRLELALIDDDEDDGAEKPDEPITDNNKSKKKERKDKPSDVRKLVNCFPKGAEILRNIIQTIIDELFVRKNVPLNNTAKTERLFNGACLMRLLAELLRSYAQAGQYLVDAHCADRTVISLIIDEFVVGGVDAGDGLMAAKAVLVNLLAVGGAVTTKASEIVVNETKTLLAKVLSREEKPVGDTTTMNVGAGAAADKSGEDVVEMETKELKTLSGEQQFPPPASIHPASAPGAEPSSYISTSMTMHPKTIKQCESVTALASLILLLRDCAQENGIKVRDIKTTYALIRHIHKKNLVVDFAKAIWHLPLKEKQSVDCINVILQMFESIMQDLVAINSVRSANATAATASATAAAAIAAATQAAAQVQARAADGTNATAASGLDSADAFATTADVPVAAHASAPPPTTTTTPTTGTAAGGGGADPIVQSSAQRDDEHNADSGLMEGLSAMATAAGHDVSQAGSENTSAIFPTDAEMSELNVSQVFVGLDQDTADEHTSEEESSEESSHDDEEEEHDDDDVMEAHIVIEEGGEDEEGSTVGSEQHTSDEGSDGEGNPAAHHDDDTIVDDDANVVAAAANADAANAIIYDGLQRQHRALTRELALAPQSGSSGSSSSSSTNEEDDTITANHQVRTSTPISEHELDDEPHHPHPHHSHHHHHIGAHDDDALMHNERGILDGAQRDDEEDDDDDDDDEEGMDEDPMEDDEQDEDAVEFDDVLNDFLDVGAFPPTGGVGGAMPGGMPATAAAGMFGAVGGPFEPTANVRVLVGNEFFPGANLGHGLMELNGDIGIGTLSNLEMQMANLSARVIGRATRGAEQLTLTFPMVSAALERPPNLASLYSSATDAANDPSSSPTEYYHPLLRRPDPTTITSQMQQQAAVQPPPAANAPPPLQPPAAAAAVAPPIPAPANDLFAVNDGATLALAAIVGAAGGDASAILNYHVHPLAQQHIQQLGRLSHARRIQQSGIRRQNALRRWQPILAGGPPPFVAAQHLSGGRNSRFTRLFNDSMLNDGLYRSQGFEENARRRAIQQLVPFFVDRLFDLVRLLDGMSMHYTGIIADAYVESFIGIRENPNEAASGTNAEAAESPQQSAGDDFNQESTMTSNNAERSEQLTAQTVEQLQISTDNGEGNTSTTPGYAEAAENAADESAGESIDSSELSNRLADLPASVESSDETTRESAANENNNDDGGGSDDTTHAVEQQQQSTTTTAENAQATETMEVDATGGNAREENQPSTSNPIAAASEPSTMEDFREILGNIEIPEGVDPAFLAALPEDIRQEVIRDHMVQQRAQRINRARRETAAAEAGGGGAADEDNDELDQEFLAALVPELQEEVLAQHEQRIAQRNREREAAAVAVANPPAADAGAAGGEGVATAAAAANTDTPVDVEAIFESLPPGLRAQVLADADDSVLRILPPNLLAEANRLRANLDQQQVFRFVMDRPARAGGRVRAVGGGNTGGGAHHHDHHHRHSSMGHQAGGGRAGGAANAQPSAAGIEQKGVQMFDRESLVTLLLLYFHDQEKCYVVRLQRLLKTLCLHAGTCDQIVWSMLSILNVLDNGGEEDMGASNDGWLDAFHTQTALNRVEKAIYVSADGAKVHPLVRQAVCGRVLDTLLILARTYPQHFLPNKIRAVSGGGGGTKRFDNVPDLSAFWKVAFEINKKGNEDFKTSVKALAQLREILPPSLEKSPMAFLLEFANREMIKHSTYLIDKSLKILQIVAQSIPSDSQAKINEHTSNWLAERLHDLAHVILHACSDEGLKDGRLFFIEIIRILPTLRSSIFEMLYKTICEQGERLQVDINALLAELEDFKRSGKVDVEQMMMRKKAASESEKANAMGGIRSNSSATNVLNASSSRDLAAIDSTGAAADLQPSVLNAFTKRNSQPKMFLKSLETVSYLRNQLKVLVDRRKRAAANAATTAAASVTSTHHHQAQTQAQQPPASGDDPAAAAAQQQHHHPHEQDQPPQAQQAAASLTNVVASGSGTSAAGSAAAASTAVARKKAAAAAAAISTISILEDTSVEERCLAEMLDRLEPLWTTLSNCLEEMSRMLDSHAVLSLQQAAEAFFLAHAFAFNQKELENQLKEAHAQPLLSIQPHAAASSSASSLGFAPPVPSTSSSSGGGGAPAAIMSTSLTAGNLGTHLRLDELNKYTQKMFHFAEKHRAVLNQILRGNTNNLMEDSAFAILTYFPKLLDFDVKRKYFYKEIRKLDDRSRYEDVAVRIRRNHLFGDSFRELIRLRPSDWKSRFYIIFEGEEGQDAGGLLREWYTIITREVFNPNYALFITAPGDRVTYMINKSSYINPEHLDYFKFIGRVIAKAIYDNKQLDCYFTRAFYKHILNVPVRYQDIESEDPSFFKSLEYLLKYPVETLGVELTFSVEVEEFGERSMRKLREDGDRISVTDANKDEYVQLVCQMKMTGSIRKQLDAFLEGFYQIIPKKLIAIFNEQELELLLSGLPEIDIDDLCNNTDYKGYSRTSVQIQWFWRALRSFEREDMAKFLQFVTGTSKVPLQGFAHLEGMNGVQKFTIHMDSRSNDRLPSAHTCFNQLDLPKYDNYEQLREMLLLAIRECSEGFAFA